MKTLENKGVALSSWRTWKRSILNNQERSSGLKATLTNLLHKFKKLFTWKPDNMVGINTKIITHELNIVPTMRPIAPKRKPVSEEKSLVIK